MDVTTFSVDQPPFLDFAQSGLSVVAIAADGSKRPLVAWRDYQARLPTVEEIRSWICSWPRSGLAVIGGVVSGGLEILDFDDGDLFPPWRDRCPVGLAERLPTVETPSGGYHVYFRCASINGNTKIAVTADGKETLIETRGEGGYVLAPGCPAACHPAGRPYVQVSGPVLPDVPTITHGERKAMWAAARTFDERPRFEDEIQRQVKEAMRSQRPSPQSDEVTPWEDFDRRGEWRSILEPVGWTTLDGVHWRRPGKQDGGISAKLNVAKNSEEVLTVFSTNSGELSPHSVSKSWGKSTAYAMLHHRGDKQAAARELRRLGYGGGQ